MKFSKFSYLHGFMLPYFHARLFLCFNVLMIYEKIGGNFIGRSVFNNWLW